MPPAPPPHTPTPHRFLPTSLTRPKPTPTPLTPQSRPQQFVPTPRFSFTAGTRRATLHHDANPHPAATGPSSSPLVPEILRYRPRLVRAKAQAEDVDSERDEGEDTRQEEDGNGDEQPTTETNHSTPSPSSPPRHPKRRRFKPPSTLPPAPHFLTTPPHAPPPPPPALPKFLLPSPPSPPAPTALTFSPQRRAQKFVTGGLAASLRDLVVETAVQGSRDARTGRSASRWDFRVRVCEVRGAALGVGIVLVKGGSEGRGVGSEGREEIGERDEGIGEEGGWKSEDGGAKGWALIGRAAHEEVTRGCKIGVRRPVWEVEVLGERWVVGVEWGVLAL